MDSSWFVNGIEVPTNPRVRRRTSKKGGVHGEDYDDRGGPGTERVRGGRLGSSGTCVGEEAAESRGSAGLLREAVAGRRLHGRMRLGAPLGPGASEDGTRGAPAPAGEYREVPDREQDGPYRRRRSPGSEPEREDPPGPGEDDPAAVPVVCSSPAAGVDGGPDGAPERAPGIAEGIRRCHSPRGEARAAADGGGDGRGTGPRGASYPSWGIGDRDPEARGERQGVRPAAGADGRIDPGGGRAPRDPRDRPPRVDSHHSRRRRSPSLPQREKDVRLLRYRPARAFQREQETPGLDHEERRHLREDRLHPRRPVRPPGRSPAQEPRPAAPVGTGGRTTAGTQPSRRRDREQDGPHRSEQHTSEI